MGSLAHICVKRRPLVTEMQRVFQGQIHTELVGSGVMLAQFQARPLLLDRVVTAQTQDLETARLINRVQKGELLGFTVVDGILRLESRLYVPNIDDLKRVLLEEAHHSAYFVHPGSTKMFHDLRTISSGGP